MKKNLLIALLLFSFNSFGQTTLIPDPLFEQALIDLGYDLILDGTVLNANVNTVTSLDISAQMITDISGIESFTSLEYLDCSSNVFINFDISQLSSLDSLVCLSCFNPGSSYTFNPNLQYLDCRGNQIDSLDVSPYTNLKYVHCSTPMVYINVQGLDSLEILNCRFAWLPSIDVSQNVALRILNLFNTQLTALDISNNILLEDLDCNLNDLIMLDVSQNTLLTSLTCTSNELTSLDVSQNIALDTFQCNGNHITTLDVSQNPALTYLGCSANLLTQLDVSANPNLQGVNAYNNNLSCLNLKNGNNTIFLMLNQNMNPNLTCIQVDNATYSDTTWIPSFGNLDPGMYYSEDCNDDCSVSLEYLGPEDHYLIKTINLMGIEVIDQPNKLLIQIYSDGTTKKVFRVE